MKGIDTFLLDLDGTLLPMDMNVFLKNYLREVGETFADLMEPKRFIGHLLTATQSMLDNTGIRTNAQVFVENFAKLVDGKIDIYMDRFDAFYDDRYLKLQEHVYFSPLVVEAIKTLKSKGYKLVIATNPIFPHKAVIHRIKWAKLDPDDFEYISSFEKNHYCKPKVEFFQEVLKYIEKKSQQCIMVGNDVQEDLAANLLGIKTFLITDHMFNRAEHPIESTYTGTYGDFYSFVEELPNVE